MSFTSSKNKQNTWQDAMPGGHLKSILLKPAITTDKPWMRKLGSDALLRTLLLFLLMAGSHLAKGQNQANRADQTIHVQRIHAVTDSGINALGAADNEENIGTSAKTIQTALGADIRLNHILMVVDREYAPNLVANGDPFGDLNTFSAWLSDSSNSANFADYHVWYNNSLGYQGVTGGRDPYYFR